ncbi:MAG: YaiI/YqxD family protein [bacterium]
MENEPTIWVDADAAPRVVREVLLKAADKREVKTIFVANRWMEDPKSAFATAYVVGQGQDVADDYIAENCVAGDLCITADIPLAARVVDKGGDVITPRGRDLDKDNVTEALSLRDFHDELRNSGVQTGGPAPFDDKAKQLFANALDRWITRRKSR